MGVTMRKKKYKPGPGWHFYWQSTCVHEHITGLRAQTSGICRTPSGDILEIPDDELSLYRRVCDGNNNRAAMAWAKDNII